jgi:hypothetical protein
MTNMLLRPVLAAAALVLLSACSMLPSWPSEPWVKPYERERFADPVMNAQRDSLAARHNSHVREVREAARGAVAVQGGGCGCN